MTRNEVNTIVGQAVEHLEKAQPGRPAVERAAHRQAANDLLAPLTMSDLRKIDEELQNLMLAYA